MSTSLFSSHEYALYRFEYPESLFHPLRSFIHPALRQDPLRVLDLGCGTGLVTKSFLKFYPGPLEMDLADPDEEMLQKARDRFESSPAVGIRSIVGASSEKLPYPEESFDCVLIGSAWHWMSPQKSVDEIERVLKPNGVVFIFEYQFPKTPDLGALNDWIRIQFNTEWKPEIQNPRGSLKEITECWRTHPLFSQMGEETVIQNRLHDSSELAGVIASQSRYQHYEQSFSSSERPRLRNELELRLNGFLKEKVASFRYEYEGFFFKKRP